ncbi:hypothetical protein ACFLQR_02080 [Verrucomicrobiota bacterium]
MVRFANYHNRLDGVPLCPCETRGKLASLSSFKRDAVNLGRRSMARRLAGHGKAGTGG